MGHRMGRIISNNKLFRDDLKPVAHRHRCLMLRVLIAAAALTSPLLSALPTTVFPSET